MVTMIAVITESFKTRGIALVHTGVCIYFCYKLIGKRWSPYIVQCPVETVLNLISKSFEC